MLSRGSFVRNDDLFTGKKGGKSAGQSVKKQRDMRAVERETDFFNTRKKIAAQEAAQDAEEPPSDGEQPEDAAQDAEEPAADDVEAPARITTPQQAQLLRRQNQIKTKGDDLPLPIGSFEDLVSRFDLDRKLLDNLVLNGFTEPTPIQMEAIPAILNNRDLLACSPTGSGKTLAFLIPLLARLGPHKPDSSVRSLIITPTKELSQQIFDEVSKLTKNSSVKCGLLSRSLSNKYKNKVIKQDKFDLLISTPLRLIELVNSESIDLGAVEILVLDEADKLFDKTFIAQTDDILSKCQDNPKLNKLMFSATIPSNIEDMSKSVMISPIRTIIGHKEAANKSIEQKLVYCGNEEGKLIAIRQLIQNGEFKPPIIIFLQSITRAKALFHELLYDRLNVDVIHAEKTQAQRTKTIENFKAGKIWVLICTDVLARGVDFKGINLVINYDVPQTAQAYVHRIGRTGRAGKAGKSVTFYTKEDAILIKPIVNVMKQSGALDSSDWLNEHTRIKEFKDKFRVKKVIDRKSISTVPKVIKKERKRKIEMIEGSKRRESKKKQHKQQQVEHNVES